MKKFIILIIVLIAGYFLYKNMSAPVNQITDEQADLILFHGDGCPHCKIVSDYISANKVAEKIKISSHEVYYNKTNQNLLTETVKKCPEIDSTQGVGVPLGYDKVNNKCLYGDQPIIDWIKAKMLK